ncbi:hypothetical protein NW752_004784 [Fusarium irregulare]|nr:hypothetical protein NW752_004784 [Fusarium irregulare]
MADTQDKVSPAPATAPPSDTTADVPSGMDGQGPNKTHVNIVEHARAAAHKERNMTLRQGIKLYPKAIFWSVLISTCIVMEGYDISLVNNFYAFPQFNKKYGVMGDNGEYQVPAPWQAGLSNGAHCGEIIGLFINGWISERFGYRYTVMACLVCVAGFTTIFFTAQNVQTLLVAEILCGIPWGIFQTLTITYASEVCPVALRGYLTTYVNFCWGLGQEIGIGVIHSMLKRDDEWAYRIPYALQWMWPLPLLIGIFFAPESPWWLVRRGRNQDAKEALLRLTSLDRETDFDADETIAMMVHTTALEEKITAGASYWDCFKGTDLRRTEIVCMIWAIQNLSGNSFSNYSTYFLEQAGLSADKAYSFALGQYGINMAGVFGAWGLMSLGIGRRSNVVGIINSVLTPYMLNPTAWDWGNYAGFFWGGICFLCIIYTFFRLPEPSGRTFAELDVLFERGISARKFASTEVDVFHETVEENVMNRYEELGDAPSEKVHNKA